MTHRAARRRAVSMVAWVALAALPGALGAHEHEWETLELRRAPAGIRAPGFALRDVQGQELRLAGLEGRPVLLNFWASWCLPCEMEMASIQRLADRFGSLDLAVVGVNLRESPARVAAFARERQLGFTMLVDPDGAVFHQYQVETLPFTVLLDRRGQVRAVAEGPRVWDSPEAVALIERLARERH